MTVPPQTNDKKELRRWATEQRAIIDPAWRAQAEAAARANAIRFVKDRNAKTVALFASFGDEIDTHQLILELLARGVTVALPRVERAEKKIVMRAVATFPDSCRAGVYGILEPDPDKCPHILDAKAFDVIFVPGLLFTREGWRLGYGGGYYDRLLNESHTALAAGYGFSKQIIQELPHAEYDKPVDALITDEAILIR